tara:strand:- start:1808 stop:2191 length:384 start_codon:yes stop_codon:yes gene_type:complete
MLIIIPVSLGELLDKISILIIKEKNIIDKKKQIYIKEELKNLLEKLEKTIPKSQVEEFIIKLIDINTKLWNIEDNIRECERKSKFDQKFINLARSVYITNDKRSKIKLEINKKFGSKIVEVKSYKEY